MADARDGSLPTTADLGSRTMLLLPDLIASWLTGSMYAEVTNASTTGLVDARTRSWSEPLLARLRIEAGLDLEGLPGGRGSRRAVARGNCRPGAAARRLCPGDAAGGRIVRSGC